MHWNTTRTCRRSSRYLSARDALFLSVVLCSGVEGSERAVGEERQLPATRSPSSAQVIADTEKPLSVGYTLGRGETTVSLTSTFISFDYKVLAESDTQLEPERFVRMWGTRDGMGALAQALADLLAGDRANIRTVDVRAGSLRGPVEAAAIFQGDEGVQLLLVRFEGEKAVFEVLAVVTRGCSATPQGGNCSCFATGADAKCSTGVYQTGTYWAKCKDASGTMECTWNGSTCGCTAAQ